MLDEVEVKELLNEIRLSQYENRIIDLEANNRILLEKLTELSARLNSNNLIVPESIFNNKPIC